MTEDERREVRGYRAVRRCLGMNITQERPR